MFSISFVWGQACINGHQFAVEATYIGVVYQFGVKGMRARKHVQYQFGVGGGQACINGHQFGVEESTDYIGSVYQFGVKGMHTRKHVQYQFDTEPGWSVNLRSVVVV